MSKVTALKRDPAAAAPAPDRAALAEAIIVASLAEAKCKAKEMSIERAKTVIDEAERTLETARAEISRAHDADVAKAAALIDKNAVRTATAARTSRALEAQFQAGATLEIQRGALARLQAELVDLMDGQATANSEVLVCIKEITRPIAERLLDETRELKTRLAVTQSVLSTLLATDQNVPTFSDENFMMRLRAQDRRASVLKQINEKFQHMLLARAEADQSAARSAAAVWQKTLAALRVDASAELPPLDAPDALTRR